MTQQRQATNTSCGNQGFAGHGQEILPILGELEIEWKKSIKYQRVQLDRRLNFGEHLQIANAKAIQCGAALIRLMPNIGGPREAKRRLVASVVNSKLRYAAPIWTSTFQLRK